MKNKKSFILIVFTILPAVLFGLTACGDSPFNPTPPGKKGGPPVTGTEFGLVEVTISGIGTDKMSASARPVMPITAFDLTEPVNNDNSGDGTIQLESVSTGSFTHGERGNGGVRYVYATFKVRNAQYDSTAYDTPRPNLTFLAVDTDASASVGETYGHTAVSALRLFDGTLLTNTTALNIARQLIPTGQVMLNTSFEVVSSGPDVLQVFTETEVQNFEENLPAGTDVNDIFPFGYVVRSPNVTPGSRTLPASPDPGRFDGIVTFAFKLLLQDQTNQDPFEISIMVLPVDDSQTRVTQSLEEQTPAGTQAFIERVITLGADSMIVLPGSVYPGATPVALRYGPVRIAGTKGSPDATLFTTVVPSTNRPVGKGGWALVSSDSHAAGQPATNLFDDDNSTYWETAPAASHQAVIDMGASYTLNGLEITGSSVNTQQNPKEITLAFSSDNVTYSTEGSYTLPFNASQQDVKIFFKSPVTARYIKLTVTSNVGSTQVTNVNEISLLNPKLFYLAANGVTVKCPAAAVGSTGVVNGITYTKRTAAQITTANAATTCTSGITNMSSMFAHENSFNGDISSWDVSSVTNMHKMFFLAPEFNQDIGGWDVSSVTDMSGMFYYTDAFNQNIGSWDVSNVTDMSNMFNYTLAFNQNISSWDVSSVTNMQYMFYVAQKFNQPIGSWDVSSVTNMDHMFSNSKVFNKDIGGWDVSSVTNMDYMFWYARAFNQDISSWCVAQFSGEPTGFSGGSPLDNHNDHQPVWGTCPVN